VFNSDNVIKLNLSLFSQPSEQQVISSIRLLSSYRIILKHGQNRMMMEGHRFSFEAPILYYTTDTMVFTDRSNFVNFRHKGAPLNNAHDNYCSRQKFMV